jgi:hypothetical protein
MKAKVKRQKAKVKRAVHEELKVLRAQRVLPFAFCLFTFAFRPSSLPFTSAPWVLIFPARKM